MFLFSHIQCIYTICSKNDRNENLHQIYRNFSEHYKKPSQLRHSNNLTHALTIRDIHPNIVMKQNTDLKMNKLLTNKNLTIINFSIVTYFVLIYLINLYSIESFMIGFLGELLTIPFLLAEVAFLVIGIRHLTKHQRDLLTTTSVLFLAACTIITFGSIFYRILT